MNLSELKIKLQVDIDDASIEKLQEIEKTANRLADQIAELQLDIQINTKGGHKKCTQLTT